MNMKKKIILISLFVVFLLMLGVTFSRWIIILSNENATFSIIAENDEDITVIYDSGNDISGVKLIPASSKESAESNGTGIGKTITVTVSANLLFDLNLDINLLPAGLKHPSLMWAICENGTVLNSGNFENVNQGDTIKLLDDYVLRTGTKVFKLYIWIDGSIINPATMYNNNFRFILNASATSDGAPSDEVVNLDQSGANPPVLDSSMIPVIYDTANSRWIKADSTNSDEDYQWYDYDARQWANAVLVSSTNRQTYLDADNGEPIPESAILAYYVWIPRFKYKVWNINKVKNVDSYSARTTGIDIDFESGTASTGTISCNYDFSVTYDNGLSETCTGSNGDYYTHPAFTFGTNDELTGFWIGKFEVSSSSPSTSNGGGNSTSYTVRIKPNVASWRNNPLSNFYKVIYDMQISSNVYGLPTSRTNVDSHMIKNMEWGAVAYLTNSEYGRCPNDECTEMYVNNSSSYITGNSGGSAAIAAASGTSNAYNTATGQLASTTGNIYGVYDMSGGAHEFSMGNMSSVSGSYTFNVKSAGSYYTYSGNEKYVDTYSLGSEDKYQKDYNRSRLGDATGEVSSSTDGKGWNLDYAYFVKSGNDNAWFRRSGGQDIANNGGPGVFFFSNTNGSANNKYGTRAVLVVRNPAS